MVTCLAIIALAFVGMSFGVVKQSKLVVVVWVTIFGFAALCELAKLGGWIFG